MTGMADASKPHGSGGFLSVFFPPLEQLVGKEFDLSLPFICQIPPLRTGVFFFRFRIFPSAI